MTLRIDNDFCRRFLENLPEQEIAYDSDKDQIVPVTEHWIGQMVNRVLSDEDSSVERFSALIKAQYPLLQQYADVVGKYNGMIPEMIETFTLELVAFFAYEIAKSAHIEAIKRIQAGGNE